MPSKSPVQARLMAAAAHTPGGYGGVPQSVGREFNAADTGGKMLAAKRPKIAKTKSRPARDGLAKYAKSVRFIGG